MAKKEDLRAWVRDALLAHAGRATLVEVATRYFGDVTDTLTCSADEKAEFSKVCNAYRKQAAVQARSASEPRGEVVALQARTIRSISTSDPSARLVTPTVVLAGNCSVLK